MRVNLTAVLALSTLAGGLVRAEPVPTTGVIAGTVTDARGARLEGVSVVATAPPLVGTRAEITDAQGSFELRDLPAGRYLLTYYVGETQSMRPNVIVTAGKTQRIAMRIKSTTPIRIDARDAGRIDVQTTRCASWSGRCDGASSFETVPRGRPRRW